MRPSAVLVANAPARSAAGLQALDFATFRRLMPIPAFVLGLRAGSRRCGTGPARELAGDRRLARCHPLCCRRHDRSRCPWRGSRRDASEGLTARANGKTRPSRHFSFLPGSLRVPGALRRIASYSASPDQPTEARRNSRPRCPRQPARMFGSRNGLELRSREGRTAVIGDTTEREVRVETERVIAVFTNRGARLKSWALKRYLDAEGQPLELVPFELSETQPLPFSLKLDDETLTNVLERRAVRAERPSRGQTPARADVRVSRHRRLACREGVRARTGTLRAGLSPVGHSERTTVRLQPCSGDRPLPALAPRRADTSGSRAVCCFADGKLERLAAGRDQHAAGP